MSSEISIDPSAPLGTGPSAPLGAKSVSAPKDEGFRPWHFFVLASILLATGAVIIARRSAPEHLILLSLTIAAAGAAAGAFYRMLAPLVAPRTVRASAAPLNERTRAALQREKALVLRSIKELEFDRAMGKLSQKDFDEMSARLRSRALSLMKELDAGSDGYAGTIEKELQARLAAAASIRQSSPTDASAGSNACAACGISNDHDALFCKKCGTRLHA